MRLLLFFSLTLYAIYTQGQTSCLTEKNLLAMDLRWEKAQLDADTLFLQKTLSEDFIWVHNHASLTDDKTAVIQRAKRQLQTGQNNTRSRTSSEVQVIIHGQTAVVSGYTRVDRDPEATLYHFMRTYTEVNGTCFLVGNHTMAIPAEEI
ncbi:nuclear transport factor 2 family protein [Algoriphagus namhaensis]